MPVSFLLGLGEKLPEFAWIRPALKPERIVYIGLRDVDAGEKRVLRENKIKAFSMHEVDKYGIGKVVEMALDHVNPNRDLPIHLSFDVDALDPSVAPSTGTPVRIYHNFINLELLKLYRPGPRWLDLQGGSLYLRSHPRNRPPRGVRSDGSLYLTLVITVLICPQEVNPSLADRESVRQTVAVGCSLVRSALGRRVADIHHSMSHVPSKGEALL